jgi:hypothetical protein
MTEQQPLTEQLVATLEKQERTIEQLCKVVDALSIRLAAVERRLGGSPPPGSQPPPTA